MTDPEAIAATLSEAQRNALRDRAAQSIRMAMISLHPMPRAPHIVFGHIDGPYLRRLDGGMRWLSWIDRFQVWRGKADAWSLEAKYQALEASDIMPCVHCDHFPFGQPPHARNCPAILQGERRG